MNVGALCPALMPPGREVVHLLAAQVIMTKKRTYTATFPNAVIASTGTTSPLLYVVKVN
jgi:hypothetical protein